MKKILIVGLIACGVLGIVGCENTKEEIQKNYIIPTETQERMMFEELEKELEQYRLENDLSEEELYLENKDLFKIVRVLNEPNGFSSIDTEEFIKQNLVDEHRELFMYLHNKYVKEEYFGELAINMIAEVKDNVEDDDIMGNYRRYIFYGEAPNGEYLMEEDKFFISLTEHIEYDINENGEIINSEVMSNIFE